MIGAGIRGNKTPFKTQLKMAKLIPGNSLTSLKLSAESRSREGDGSAIEHGLGIIEILDLHGIMVVCVCESNIPRRQNRGKGKAADDDENETLWHVRILQ